MFESDLSEKVKAEYSSLREKQKSFEPAFVGCAGVIPFAFSVAWAYVNGEEYKKAKYERKQERASKTFVDNNIKL